MRTAIYVRFLQFSCCCCTDVCIGSSILSVSFSPSLLPLRLFFCIFFLLSSLYFFALLALASSPFFLPFWRRHQPPLKGSFALFCCRSIILSVQPLHYSPFLHSENGRRLHFRHFRSLKPSTFARMCRQRMFWWPVAHYYWLLVETCQTILFTSQWWWR